jgi:alpha-glucosidase
MTQDPHRFLNVEQYFGDLPTWDTLQTVVTHSWDAPSHTLSLGFVAAGNPCTMLVALLRKDIFRVRFNPAKATAADYTTHNSRSVVMDTAEELRTALTQDQPFTVQTQEEAGSITLTVSADGSALPTMKLVARFDPFAIEVSGYAGGGEHRVWATAAPAIQFTANGPNDHAIVQAASRPPAASYVGFGEHGGRNLLKNGDQLTYFCFDNYAYNQVYGQGPLDDREPLYHADPFFVELNGGDGGNLYGIFLDNIGECFVDLGRTDSTRYLIGTRFGDLDYYFFLGQTCADVVDGFTSIVGRPRLKPRYALGYHQGCYGYENRGALEWAAGKYRQYGIPLDGLHIDVDIQKHYQTFTIDEGAFPSPREMFEDLREQGIKCSTNITPIVSDQDPGYPTFRDGLAKNYFVVDRRADPDDPQSKVYQQYGGGNGYTTDDGWLARTSYNSGQPYLGEVNYGGSLGTTGHYADLGRKEVRMWWGTQYEYLYEQGLEMVWQDMTTPCVRDTRGDMKGFPFRLLVTDDSVSGAEPVTNEAIRAWNLYSYNLHKATYHGLNNLAGRDNKRNFIVGRGSFTGMHRFAALWTGDNTSTWDFLRINVAQVLSLGMSAQAVCGQDIGGFAQGEPNQGWVGPELLMRWTMAGAFLPWFRNHYVRKGQKQFQEPFQYTEWFATNNQPVPDPPLYEMVVPVCRYYISLRYRLLQLFYDALFENTSTGMPICRALFLTDPADLALFGNRAGFLDNEFCVGNDLLVAPILDPQSSGSGKRDVYLPAGSDWYCFMDNRLPLDHPVSGGTTVRDFDASLGLQDVHLGFLVPIYVRAGAIVPTIELEQYVGERNAKNLPNPVTLNVYPGQSGRYTMYLDDGVSRSSAPVKPLEQGGDPSASDEYRQTVITHSYTGSKTREIKVERVHDGYTPPLEKSFFVAVLHDPSEPKGAAGTGGPLAGVSIGSALTPITAGTVAERAVALDQAPGNGWYYNEGLNRSVIKVLDDNPSITLVLTYV